MSKSQSKRLMIAFCRARSGSVAAVFGLMIIPITLFIGGAVDFLNVTKKRAELQAAADSAALAGVTAAVRQLKAGASAASAQTAGQNAATGLLNGSLPTLGCHSTFTVSPTVDSVNATYVVNATIQVSTNFLRLIGRGHIPVGVTASSSSSSGNQFMDVYLMVDTSGSMMLGASQSDIDALNAQFGCAFACHDGAAATPTNGRSRTG